MWTFCWHSFGLWVDVKRGNIYDENVKFISDKTEMPIGYFITQKRTCSKCGKVQLKTENTY